MSVRPPGRYLECGECPGCTRGVVPWSCFGAHLSAMIDRLMAPYRCSMDVASRPTASNGERDDKVTQAGDSWDAKLSDCQSLPIISEERCGRLSHWHMPKR